MFPIIMKNYLVLRNTHTMNKYLLILIFGIIFILGADYRAQNRPDIKSNRTSITTNTGHTSTTRRSDGSYSYTLKKGNTSSTTVETDRRGKRITGNTYKSGNSSVTRWSDGTTTHSRPTGNGAIITERQSNGKTITGTVIDTKNGSRTKWSNGSTNTNRNFGTGSINTDRK